MNNQINFKQVSKYEGPEESMGYLLWRVSTAWRRSLGVVLHSLGLTHPQFVVLAVIGWLTKEGGRASQTVIARSAGLDPNTASQIIRGLETKKLVERIRFDERSKNPVLSLAGKQLLAKAMPAVEQADAEFFVALASTELRQLVVLFKKFLKI